MSDQYRPQEPAPQYGQPDAPYGSSSGPAEYGAPSGPAPYGAPTGPAPYGAGGAPYGGGPLQGTDPGQTLGIVSLVASIASFFILPLIGSIVGIICGRMARNRSREAGFGDNALGKWGFIIGIISLVLALIGVVLIVIGVIVAISTAGTAGYVS